MSVKSYGYNDGYGNGYISVRGLVLRKDTSEDKKYGYSDGYGYGYISARGLVVGNSTSRCLIRSTVTVTVMVTVTLVFGV